VLGASLLEAPPCSFFDGDGKHLSEKPFGNTWKDLNSMELLMENIVLNEG
jgi:hypothetical protein